MSAVVTPLRAADLVGGYTVAAGEKFGAPESPDRLEGLRVWFTEATVTVSDKDKQATYAASYLLDPDRTPCGITMTATAGPDVGAVAHGLIEKDGDTVRLVYSLPGHEPPTDFRTARGQLLFELRSLNK